MNSNVVKPEKIDHFHLVYHFTVPLMVQKRAQLEHSSHIVKVDVEATC